VDNAVELDVVAIAAEQAVLDIQVLDLITITATATYVMGMENVLSVFKKLHDGHLYTPDMKMTTALTVVRVVTVDSVLEKDAIRAGTLEFARAAKDQVATNFFTVIAPTYQFV
jgi:hypothetical protein